MKASLPHAAPGYRWELNVPDAPPRKRHPWRWVIGILIIVALAVGAFFVGEWLARDVTTKTIRGALVSQLGVSKDQDVEVEYQGSVLLQLMRGTLDDVTVSAEDVTLGQVTGDISVHAKGVSVRGEGAAEAGTATVSFDTAQLQTLMGTIEGFPADSLGLTAPDVTITLPLQVLGASVPVGVALQPSAADGDLVLTPSSFQLGGAAISADDLRDRFGGLAQKVLGDWNVCVAQHVPAGMTLTDVSVEGSQLVATFDLDGGILDDPELQALGTCE